MHSTQIGAILESWISKKIKEDTKREEECWLSLRKDILSKYNTIKEKLGILLNENQSVDILYKLPLKDFRMCSEANIVLFEEVEYKS